MKKILLLLIITVFIISCIQPPEAPKDDDKEALQDLLKKGIEDKPIDVIVKEKKTEIAKDSLVTESPFIASLLCDEVKQNLTFTLSNPLDKTISLVPISVMELRTKEAFKLTINGRVVRNLDELCGIDALEPNALVECSTTFIPNDDQQDILIRTGMNNLMIPLSNYIMGKTVSLKADAEFVCN